MANPSISIVVPIFNEAEVLPLLNERITATLASITGTHEIIFVNDGSNDGSSDILKEFARKNHHTKIVSLSRNFGHQIAVSAGLQYTRGDAVIVIDGDLQDPPEVIPGFIQKWQEGYDVVYGVRKSRKEGLLKKTLYFSYYRLLKMFAEIDIPIDSGDCCLMSRKVVDILNSLPERHRFVRGLRSWVGFRQTGMEYDRDKRYAGEAKYTFYKLLKLGLDGMLAFSGYPLKIALAMGFTISFMSLCYASYLVYKRLLFSEYHVPGWTTLAVGITLFGGIQLIMLGLLGEYLVRVYDESKRRPLYIIDELIGLEKDATDLSNNPSL